MSSLRALASADAALIDSQVLVGCGLVMLGTTLTHPPYFANGGSDEEGTVRQSTANRLRCAVDSATFWIYACSLAAVVLASDGAAGTCSRTPHSAQAPGADIRFVRVQMARQIRTETQRRPQPC